MKKLWYFILLMVCVSGCQQTQQTIQTESVNTKTPEQIKQETISAMIQDMTLEEQIGQLFMVSFRQNTDGSDMTVLSEESKSQIEKYAVGGVILFAENLDTVEQTKELTTALQSASDIPLFLGIDEEGGIVSRLDKSQIPHESIPSAIELSGDTQKALQAGSDIGRVLSELGISVDFAPVADVYTNAENTVIGERAYGTDAQTVADMSSAFLKGLESEGIKGVAKHFPGHGDTQTDSHDGMAVSNHDLQRLQTVEFVPFQRLIEEDISFIMTGHITLPQVTTDGLPATLSKQAIDILRNDLNFQNIIITDAMNMGAIVSYYTPTESTILAIQAGVDMILMPEDLEQAYTALLEAVEQNQISQARIEESVMRILDVKYDCGLLQSIEK